MTTQRLTFEGQAIVEVSGGCVRFAGQYTDPQGNLKTVICRVERDALIARCNLSESFAPSQLLDAYHNVSGEVNALASAQFYGGEVKPRVTKEDIMRVREG